PISKDLEAGEISEPGEDEEADNFFAVKDLLEHSGYDHYEISNFSKDRKRCLHNILYWQGGKYFGCGPAAHSHWNGKRFGNIPDLPTYCDRLASDKKPFDEVEVLTSEEKARETLVMWLRMTQGVDLSSFKDVTGYSAEELCGDSIAMLVGEGLLERHNHRLSLTRNSLFVSNAVFSELV
ncbi:MAG: hypothetical protein OES84_02970, partial [Kiritimatiellaceae bacterium]|nr:hypothetical protein [Kiritimatiellaceae bacterium]